VIEELKDCKHDVSLRLIRATLLCGNTKHTPLCPLDIPCPFKMKGRLYRGDIYTCSVSLLKLILE
jgi:hypothetical protein